MEWRSSPVGGADGRRRQGSISCSTALPWITSDRWGGPEKRRWRTWEDIDVGKWTEEREKPKTSSG